MRNEIEQITRYRFDGQEFADLQRVAKYVENEIGRILDDTPLRMAIQQSIAVYAALVKNRKRLCQLLSAEYFTDPDDLQPERKSIFDFK